MPDLNPTAIGTGLVVGLLAVAAAMLLASCSSAPVVDRAVEAKHPGAAGAAIVAFAASVPSCGALPLSKQDAAVTVGGSGAGDAGANLIMWVLHGGAALCLLACLVLLGLAVLSIMNGKPPLRLFVLSATALIVALVAEAIAAFWGVALWATIGLFVALVVAGIGGVIWYAVDVRDGRVDAPLLRRILNLDDKGASNG